MPPQISVYRDFGGWWKWVIHWENGKEVSYHSYETPAEAEEMGQRAALAVLNGAESDE